MVVDDAEFWKTQKYSNIISSHYFVPLAVESLEVFEKETQSFLKELGQRVKLSSGDPIAHLYLVQRISVPVQRRNTAAVRGSTGVLLWRVFGCCVLFLLFLLMFIKS